MKRDKPLSLVLPTKPRKVHRRKEGPITPVSETYVGVCQNCTNNRACPNVCICCGGKVEVIIRVPCPLGKWAI